VDGGRLPGSPGWDTLAEPSRQNRQRGVAVGGTLIFAYGPASYSIGKRARPMTDTSGAPATILFSVSTASAISRAACSGKGTRSAKDWKAVLDPIVARYRDQNVLRYFRGDAAFGNPNMYSYLEVEHFSYAIRLRSNDILNREIETLMTRPEGRPPRAPIVLYHEFMYQAAACGGQRGVIAKVE
jgi:Transposase DDE domain group 1